jgi:hypothetical protein
MAGADDLARKLRSEGVRAELDITGRKIDKQIKAALKKQIPFAVFVGEDEIASGAYTVRNLVEPHRVVGDEGRLVVSGISHLLPNRKPGEIDAVCVLDWVNDFIPQIGQPKEARVTLAFGNHFVLNIAYHSPAFRLSEGHRLPNRSR